MRTTLDLPDDVFRQLKAESALRGMKLKAFVTELIRGGLARQNADPTGTGARSPLPVIRRATGATHRALTNAEIEEILSVEESHGRA